jgi:Flp pilus assembly protein TadD
MREMESALEQDDIPLALPFEEGNLEEAARLLAQALEASPSDTNIAYLLALCWKRQGNPAEARSALRRITRPDANVWLQLGLLSFAEKQFAQAEEEFARAWKMDPASYEAAFNLLLTRLCLGQVEASAALISDMQPLMADPQEQHFLSLLDALLRTCLAPRRAGPPGS